MKVASICGFGAAVVLLGCGGGETAPFRQLDSSYADAPATFKSRVNPHAIRGAVIRDAVARGDLEGTHRGAHELIQLVIENERPALHTPIGEMVDAARRVEAAQSLHEAAQAFAVLAMRCGACHTAFGGPPSFPAAPPADALTLEARMRRHQWGAARMWEGLVAPSDDAWKSGAKVVADAPFDVGPRSGKSADLNVEKLTLAVHDLGANGASAVSTSSRVELYGQLLTTCAGCHEQAGGGPNGPRQ